MKKKEVEKFFSQHIPDFYSFAYIILPDSLQAQQVVIDALALVMDQNKEFLFSLSQKNIRENIEKREQIYDQLHLESLKQIYLIALKRHRQLPNQNIYLPLLARKDSFKMAFAKLPIESQIILYLHKKWDHEVSWIENIMGLLPEERVEKLQKARNELTQYLTIDSEQSPFL